MKYFREELRFINPVYPLQVGIYGITDQGY